MLVALLALPIEGISEILNNVGLSLINGMEYGLECGIASLASSYSSIHAC